MRSAGQPLAPATRTLMESQFDRDFSQVRIHTDAKAAASAQAVNASAYTVQKDIAFDAGKYAPENKAGKQLLAHELAHVVQQSRGSVEAPTNSSDSSLEHAADRAAADLDRSARPIAVAGTTAPGLARQHAPAATKAPPEIAHTITQQADRTIVAINGVAIAETKAPPAEIEFSYRWTPDRLDISIVIPEGSDAFAIPGANTNAALLKLSSQFNLTIKKKLKVPRSTFNELTSNKISSRVLKWLVGYRGSRFDGWIFYFLDLPKMISDIISCRNIF